MDRRSGFVAIIGLPNAGKSTLLNALIRQKISIVSPRPQTTRYRIEGIYTTEDIQIVFVDTPGFIRAEEGLNHILQIEIEEAIKNCDVILMLIEPQNISVFEKSDETFNQFNKKVKEAGKPLIVALNKCDTLRQQEIDRYLEIIKNSIIANETVAISALYQVNINELLDIIKKYLPEGEFLYDPDQIAIKSERFLAQEMIREQLFYLLKKEVPYECAVTIEEFDESDRDNKDEAKRIVRISGVIYVARDSLKPIIIGKDGDMIKKIGTHARKQIEELIGCKVFLSLRVIVKRNWNRDKFFLSDLGYEKV